MELKGLTLNCLGDSITEGHGASSPEKCYVSRLKSEYGINARNYGIGGARIAEQIKKNPACRYDYVDFCRRAKDMPTDADMVLVFGGTNDYGHGDAPFGQNEDTVCTTFCGACNQLFTTLKKMYPQKPIAVVLPLPREGQDHPSHCGHPLVDYVDKLRELAGGFGFYVLDLFHSGPKIETMDGLHPNDDGYAVLAREIACRIASL